MLGALVSGGASLIATDRASDSALDTQRQILEEQREDRDRTRRLSIYNEFVDAAENYGSGSWSAYTCLRDALEDLGPRPKSVDERDIDQCIDDMVSLAQKRSRFLGAYNDMYVFGSDEAVKAASAIKEVLPDSQGNRPFDKRRDHIDAGAPPFVWSVFDTQYGAFVRVMCRDLAFGTPRSGCS